MSFRIKGLDPASFRHLFGLRGEELARHGARRVVADESSGFPDRVELRDADPGETLLLLNYTHQPANNPYHASHAIFVREGATDPYDKIDDIPETLSRRLISLRGFNARHDMVQAGVSEGRDMRILIDRLLADDGIAYLHAHFAAWGCYAARVDRA